MTEAKTKLAKTIAAEPEVPIASSIAPSVAASSTKIPSWSPTVSTASLASKREPGETEESSCASSRMPGNLESSPGIGMRPRRPKNRSTTGTIAAKAPISDAGIKSHASSCRIHHSARRAIVTAIA